MSLTELKEHRSKNLCFFCHEKFSLRQSCQQQQRAQVFFFIETEDTTFTYDIALEATHGEEVENKEQLIRFSPNSLLGNICSGSNTVRIKGTMENRTLHILLDTGRSQLS